MTNKQGGVVERRTGSTGGTSTQFVDLSEAATSRTKVMNQTTQNFYNVVGHGQPKGTVTQIERKRKGGPGMNAPNIQI
jgi:hypothetical protein